MPELVAVDRWWVLHDEAIVEALLRVEAGEVSAAEMHSLLLEHTEKDEASE